MLLKIASGLPPVRMLLVTSILFVTGCGSSGPKLDPTTQVTEIRGTVVFDGKPIPVDSGIYFSSKDTGTTAGGKVDALGNFLAKAADAKVGLKAGRYAVTVRPPGPPPVAVSNTSEEYKKAMMGGGQAKQPETSPLIPKSFSSVDTTKLILEIKAGANDLKTIDLSKIQ